MKRESSRVTKPSAKTPIVCVIVTMPPSRTASTGLPFVPTRYPATIALPCPGVSAWAAPQKAAISSERRITPSERSPRDTSDSKPPFGVVGSGLASELRRRAGAVAEREGRPSPR